MRDAADIVAFWRRAGPGRWFARQTAFDQEIRDRFQDTHMLASRGECADWVARAEGALALVILLDQFPRNMFRGSAHAFATDPLARRFAETALATGFDRQVDPTLRFFFFMPFEHSETVADQDRAVALFEQLKAETGETGNLGWAVTHRDIISRFGRFPHRNTCLGRDCTAEEIRFLADGGFAG